MTNSPLVAFTRYYTKRRITITYELVQRNSLMIKVIAGSIAKEFTVKALLKLNEADKQELGATERAKIKTLLNANKDKVKAVMQPEEESTYRAKVGGEVSSVNNVEYKLRKVEIAKYNWEVQSEGTRSIWDLVSRFCQFTCTGHSKEHGSAGILVLSPNINFDYHFRNCADPAKELQHLEDLVLMWNNGERWIEERS